MIAVLKKELNMFFASPIGYLVIGLFLLINGLFLWVFKGDFNILHAGFADLNSFFFIAPWFFIFLIPAITMRSFSDEMRSGTIEILKTKPITEWHIILGKYLGALILICIALLPTLTYIYSVFQLGNPQGNIDWGTIAGSYLGLVLLGAAFTSIGIFTSTLSHNQIIAFLLGVVLCYFVYAGFDALEALALASPGIMESLGMRLHFDSIGRGVADTRDIIYFLSVLLFFLLLTKINLERK